MFFSVKKIIIILFISYLSLAVAQTDKKRSRDQQMEELMRKQLDRMNKLMEESFNDFERFDKLMDDFRKDFFQGAKRSGGDFGGLLDQFNNLNFDRKREYHWEETENERILYFKIKPLKDDPIDIKVDKDIVKISGKTETINDVIVNGKVEQQKMIVQFNRTFSVPSDCDGSATKIEKDKEGIRLRFPKLAHLRGSKRKMDKKIKLPKKDKNGLTPVAPSPGERPI
jgi:HSP20 family molecular chaperone IbpA